MQAKKEATKKARRIINKRKLLGIKLEIENYRKDIIKTLFDPKALESEIKKTSFEYSFDYMKEAEISFVPGYFDKVNDKILDLLERAREYLIKAFEKGTKRVMDNEGKTVKIEETPDEEAIQILLNEQDRFYKNVTEEQSKLINKIIAQGLDKGKNTRDITKEIMFRVKRLTYARAKTIANTEMVKSHNLGQIRTMQEAGIEFYNYITSNDNKVSAICKKHQGPRGREKKYQVALAGTEKHPLPVLQSHPNCRCVTVVYTPKR